MSFTLKKSNLNFKVYTVPTKPTTAGVENDIAIISSVPMPNWMLSPDGPSGIPRSDGDVWIQYSVSGNTFNALKNNSMMIATISAWQYVSGAWVDVTAMSYQGGEWVEWISENALYCYGRQKYTWSASTMRSAIAGNQTGIAPKVTTNPDGSSTIYIPSSDDNQWLSGAYIMDDSIDLTNISLIEMHYVWYSSPNKIALSVIPVNADAWGDDRQYGGDTVAYAFAATNSTEILSVDVSNLSGKYLLCIGIQCSRNTLGGLTLQTVFSYT